MAKFGFNLWEEIKWGVSFEAENLDHAKKLIDLAQNEMDVEVLPNVERFFKKGDETWDLETLTEIEATEEVGDKPETKNKIEVYFVDRDQIEQLASKELTDVEWQTFVEKVEEQLHDYFDELVGKEVSEL